jgi:hypothetical protein
VSVDINDIEEAEVKGGLDVRGATPGHKGRSERNSRTHTQRIEDQVESQVMYKMILRHPEDPNTEKKKKNTKRGE